MIPARTPSATVDLEAGKAAAHAPARRKGCRHPDGRPHGQPRGATWDVQTAKAVLKALEPYDLFLFEEPLPYTDPWGYAELRSATSVPVAGGECLTTLNEFRQFADLDA